MFCIAGKVLSVQVFWSGRGRVEVRVPRAIVTETEAHLANIQEEVNMLRRPWTRLTIFINLHRRLASHPHEVPTLPRVDE